MPTRNDNKHNLIIYLVLSALIHFFTFYLTPINMSPKTSIHNQKLELSWHILQSLPTTQYLKNDSKHVSKPKDSAHQSSANESAFSPPPLPSKTLTKQPEMISDELLFVETDFGYQANGSITIMLTIGKDGSVKKAIKTHSTARPLFEDQVLKHILKSTWSPAEINGSPIETNITLTIDVGN